MNAAHITIINATEDLVTGLVWVSNNDRTIRISCSGKGAAANEAGLVAEALRVATKFEAKLFSMPGAIAPK